MEVFRTSSKPGSQHHRQAIYTTLRRIGGCPVQPKISCDSPSAVQAGLVASLRQTGLPSPAMIGMPLIIVDWAERELHNTTEQSRDQKIPGQKVPVGKIGCSQVDLERRRVHIRVEIRNEMKKVHERSRTSNVKHAAERNIQLSLPRISRYNPLRPKKLRKYHERDETHRTSISGVSIPRCSIDLNPNVRGNGSLTMWNKPG